MLNYDIIRFWVCQYCLDIFVIVFVKFLYDFDLTSSEVKRKKYADEFCARRHLLYLLLNLAFPIEDTAKLNDVSVSELD